MRVCLTSVVLSVVLVGCASVMPRTDLRDMIVGVWHLKDYGDGNYQFSQLGFTADGRKCVVSFEIERDGVPRLDYYDNSWSIEDGTLVTVVGDSPSSSLPRGYVIRDRIKTLGEDNMDLLMESSSSYQPRLEKHVKLHGVSPSRICEIVENYRAQTRRSDPVYNSYPW